MRQKLGYAGIGVLLLTSCVGELYEGPEAAEVRSDPSILYMAPGETQTVTVEAFVGNEPESVRWGLGTVGAGLAVEEDTTFGTMFIGGQLVLPSRSHARRYVVTMSGSSSTSFVVSGGTGVIEIPVRPPEP